MAEARRRVGEVAGLSWAFTGTNTVIEYVKTMMRKEPITFGVLILMIAILIFGAWDSLRVVKRYNAPQTDVESPKNP